MGTWLGHAAPGTFFILFSTWWLIRSLYNYFSRPSRYTNSISQFCCCKRGCLGRIPLDSWILMFVAVLGVIMEIATSMATVGEVVMGNRQHLTMYISFGLVGLVSILLHHKVKFVPKGADYLSLIIALAVEMVLFAFHLHGRDEADKHIHMLLVYTVAASLIVTCVEMNYSRSINASLARHFLGLVQGTWFYQIAFTLYPPEGMPKWDLTDEALEGENIMLITLIFSWHLIGCLMVMLILSGLTYWCCSPKCRGEYENEASLNLLPVHDSKGSDASSPALMSGYVSVGSDDESTLFSATTKSSEHL